MTPAQWTNQVKNQRVRRRRHPDISDIHIEMRD